MTKLDGKDVWLIDAHTHMWDNFAGTRGGGSCIELLGYGRARLDGEEYRFLPASFRDGQVPYEVYRGYMDDIGVDQVFVLQNPCYGDQRDYIRDKIKEHPDYIIGTVGKMDPRETDKIAPLIDTYVHEYGFKGIKIEVPDSPFFMDEPQYDFMWKKLADEDLMVAIDLGFGYTPYDFNIERLERVLQKYPNLRLRLPHLGICKLTGHEQKHPYPELQRALKLVDTCPNLYFDISGMPFFNPEEEYPDTRNVDILKVVYETIGADRLLWGSDFPTITRLRTMRQCLELLTVQCDFIPFEDKVKILGTNALKEQRLEMPAH